ncbi:MAG: bifunctional lysylphosphatidylglycerol flippase/synthetase MprF, partial [Mycobacteriales bacterium]
NSVYPSPRPGTVIVEVLGRLVGVSGPLQVSGPFGRWFPQSLTVAGLLTAAWAIGLLLAPVRDTSPAGRGDGAALRPLLSRPDGDTLDPFVLRGDKSHVFSPDRQAVLGYRYLAGVGLAAGDPVGDPASFPAAVGAFLDLCDRHGWRPAIIAVRGDRVPLYETLGLRSIYVGDEAVVDVAAFSLTGRSRRNVRQAVQRTHNSGVAVELVREGTLEEGLRQQLLRIDALDRGRAPDRGFAMALDGLLSGRDADCLLVMCRNPGGEPVAFQRYVPCLAGRGLSLDAMRRLPDAPNGVNERMIVELLEWCRGRDVTEVSLNFSAFRRLLDPAVRHGRGQEAEAWLLRRFDPVVQLHSLYRFNAKFGPRWVPRHVVYRSRADLGAIGLAALAAEAYLPGARRPSPPGSQGEQVREPVPMVGGAPE